MLRETGTIILKQLFSTAKSTEWSLCWLTLQRIVCQYFMNHYKVLYDFRTRACVQVAPNHHPRGTNLIYQSDLLRRLVCHSDLLHQYKRIQSCYATPSYWRLRHFHLFSHLCQSLLWDSIINSFPYTQSKCLLLTKHKLSSSVSKLTTFEFWLVR